MPPKSGSGTDVRKVRSPHGTRVARRIVCSACGAEDTLAFAPKDQARALCRACAYTRLGIRDRDEAALRQVRLPCVRCGEEALLPSMPRDDKEVLCRDCKLGIETNQQNRTGRARRVKNGVIRVEKKEKT